MHKIAILYDASHAILSTFDLDEALNRILAILRDYFHLHSGAILLVNPESRSLTVRSAFNMEGVTGSLLIPLGHGITGRAARTKRPVYSPDVQQDPRYLAGDPRTRSEVAVPLIVRNEVVGILDCQSDKPDAFDEEMVDLLTLFATKAAIALQNCELYARERRRTAQLEAINSIAKQATAVLNVSELLETVCARIPRSFPVDHVSAFLFDSEKKLVLRREEGSLRCRVQEGEEISGSLHIFNADADIRAHFAEQCGGGAICEGAGSELHLPLVSFGERLGLLVCSSLGKKAFDTSDIGSLESMGDIIATSIQNACYVEKLRGLANIDGLTRIYNRRFFESKLPEKIAEASRYGGCLSLLMIDIDKFKSINDDFGHLLGDEVLRQVSSLLKQALRKVDLLCRYGGEELAVIAPATPASNALALAEKLRKAVAEHSFPGIPRPVTVSVGVAEYPGHGTTRDALVALADAALYRAKQAGRNCALLAESSPGATLETAASA